MPIFNSTPRGLPWRLRGVVSPVQTTPGDAPDDQTLQWPTTDPDEVVSMEVRLSLNECVALATAVDVGRDIAYNTQSQELWLLWCRIWKEACIAEFNFESQARQAVGSATDYDDFLERLSEIMPKFRGPDGKLYEPVIDLVECGCSDGVGGTGSDSGALGVPGGTVGEAYSGDIPSLCDLITGNFASFLSQRVDDLLGLIANQTFILENLSDFFPVPIAEGWVDEAYAERLAIEAQLTDPTWLNAMNIAFVKAFNDPVSPPLTRRDLFKLVRFLPPISEGAPMLPIMSIWSGVANLQEINNALRFYVGEGDPAVCKPVFIASGTGREPYHPGGESGTGGGTIEYPNGGSPLVLRVSQMVKPFTAFNASDAFLTPDYTGKTVVGGGYVIGQNLTTNDDWQPYLFYNNKTGTFGHGSDFTDNGEDFHYAARFTGLVLTDTWFQIRAAVEEITGVPITQLDVLAQSYAISDPAIFVASNSLGGGQSTVLWGWTVELA